MPVITDFIELSKNYLKNPAGKDWIIPAPPTYPCVQNFAEYERQKQREDNIVPMNMAKALNCRICQ